MERLCECDVAPVSQWRDDKTWCVTQVLIRVFELCITDIGVAVLACFVPSMSELWQPHESLRAVNLPRKIHIICNQIMRETDKLSLHYHRYTVCLIALGPHYEITLNIVTQFSVTQLFFRITYCEPECLRYSSDWKLSLQNHSCNIPLESSWHQEVKNHHIFCVASNDATLWIATKLTCITLFEL